MCDIETDRYNAPLWRSGGANGGFTMRVDRRMIGGCIGIARVPGNVQGSRTRAAGLRWNWKMQIKSTLII